MRTRTLYYGLFAAILAGIFMFLVFFFRHLSGFSWTDADAVVCGSIFGGLIVLYILLVRVGSRL